MFHARWLASLDTKDDYQPGVYTVEKVEYQYGDGQAGTTGSHNYAQAGAYTVHASLVMDVAPGTEVYAPFPDGFAVLCSPTRATIV